jgi:hypothetical protein
MIYKTKALYFLLEVDAASLLSVDQNVESNKKLNFNFFEAPPLSGGLRGGFEELKIKVCVSWVLFGTIV